MITVYRSQSYPETEKSIKWDHQKAMPGGHHAVKHSTAIKNVVLHSGIDLAPDLTKMKQQWL